jgi:hypothetical protein
MAALIVGGSSELRDLHMPRVEWLNQPLDGSAFSGRVPTLEDHANGRAQAVVGCRVGVIEWALAAERKAQLAEPRPSGIETPLLLPGFERER